MPLSKIDSDSLNTGAVTSTALGTGAVTSTALAAGSVASAALASGVPTRAQMPVGSVLQVVQDTFATTYSTTSGGGTQFRSVSITPSSASSKILVLTSFMCRATGNGGNAFIRIQAFRNGNLFWNGYPVVGATGPTDIRGVAAINYLDSPNTTSSVAYSFNFDSTFANEVFINSTTNPSFITLMEIAA